jgi:hypothetical protein
MSNDYWTYQWVLNVYRYDGIEELLASLEEQVIAPAESKAKELATLKATEFLDDNAEDNAGNQRKTKMNTTP